MKFSGICFAILCLVVSCPLLLSGQASPSPSTIPQDLYPDQGYLSATRYANRYFGFAFDLPADVQLQPIPQPVARDTRIQVLQLGGPPPAYATVAIVAFPLRGKTAPDAKAILHKAFEQELFHGVEQLHGLSKISLSGHLFYFYETRRGADQHMALATDLDGYAVLATLAANNEKTVKELEMAFQHLAFLAPAQVRAYAGADAEEYEGPAISSHELAKLLTDPPANHMDAGKFSGHLYENRGLGFRYRIPSGWTLESEGAVQPAVERSRKRDDLQAWMGASERDLMKVCNRTLLSAWAKRPGADGELTYDDFGEVTVTAASASCFPGIRFPARSDDRQAIKDFVLQFGLTHPILSDMRDAKAFTSGGTVVVFLHGTVGFQVPGDALSRRLSIAMAITSRRGCFLTWFFAAAHDSELRELLDEKVSFDPEPLNKDIIATKPGGGANLSPNSQTSAPALADVVPSNAEPVAASARAPGANAQAGADQASAGTTSAASPTKQQDEPDTSASSLPSLLRPGENVQDQQVNGKPLPQQTH